MSLPSYCSLRKEGVEVARKFVNCGWFCTGDSIFSAIVEMLEDYRKENPNFKTDVDEFVLYGYSVKMSDVIKLYLRKISRDDFARRMKLLENPKLNNPD